MLLCCMVELCTSSVQELSESGEPETAEEALRRECCQVYGVDNIIYYSIL